MQARPAGRNLRKSAATAGHHGGFRCRFVVFPCLPHWSPLLAPALATAAPEADVQDVNVARLPGVTVLASSALKEAAAALAIDGNVKPALEKSRSGFVSLREDEPWWQIDLGAAYLIDRIVVVPRTDAFPEQLERFHLSVGLASFATRTRAQAVEMDGAWRLDHVARVVAPEVIPVGQIGRHVRIQRWTPGTLALVEVEIYARRISDAGEAASVLPVQLYNRAEPLAWGVSTDAADQAPTAYIRESRPAPVWALQPLGDRVFVGGRFLQVQKTSDGTKASRPFLAAFDRASGEWINSFAPTFNGPIFALAVLPSGKLLVGGEFTEVNGVPRKGLVAIDPITGETDPVFSGRLNIADPAKPMVHGIDIQLPWVYVAGRFGSAVGGPAPRTVGALENAARFDATTGLPDKTWIPLVDGTVWDIAASPTNDRVVLAGSQRSVNGDAAQKGMALLDGTTGAPVPGAPPWLDNAFGQYFTWTAASIGDRFLVGGSPHAFTDVNKADRSVRRRHEGYMADTVGKFTSWQNAGGDFQAIVVTPYETIGACHCTSRLYVDTPAGQFGCPRLRDDLVEDQRPRCLRSSRPRRTARTCSPRCRWRTTSTGRSPTTTSTAVSGPAARSPGPGFATARAPRSSTSVDSRRSATRTRSHRPTRRD